MPANMKFKEGRCRNTGVPQGHLHFYPNYKFGEMLAYFKPFRRRSSVFRQAENSRFSWGINKYRQAAGIIIIVSAINSEPKLIKIQAGVKL